MLIACAPGAWAQDVSVATLQNVPADMIEPAPVAQGDAIDLGQSTPAGGAASASAPGDTVSGAAIRAASAARRSEAQAGRTRRPPATEASARAGVERAVFERQPIAVPLPVGRERLITLPAPAALHVPSDMARVARIEIIDRTIYATALVPFTPIRIVAELIDSGQQLPMDMVADKSTADAQAELEVFVVEPTGQRSAKAGAQADERGGAAPEQPAADMVELTRHAARQLYAPRRLAWTQSGVQQVELNTDPMDGLLPGAQVETAPLGQWRSGQLYVTAVRVTNRSARALEIPLEGIRGRWLAATAQHGRIGPAGSDTDTTALYLVCDRSFAACLR
jgi:integrating conjugative element protein (TIGR03749 family)